MYKIRFNTEKFDSRRRRDWNNQLYNDFAVAINGKEYICDSREQALDRLKFIAGISSTIDQSREENHIYLEDERYSKQFMPLRMPGIPQGYVDIEKRLDRAEQNGKESIAFDSFYDLRQGRFFKGCFIEITVE